MTLVGRRVEIPPDPLAIARRLADRPGFVFLWAPSGAGPSFIASDPVDVRSALDPEPSLGLDPRAGPLAAVPRWMGLLPYEGQRGLERPKWTRSPEDRAVPHLSAPRWLRFGAVVRVAEDVLVVGDDRAAVDRLGGLLRAAPRGPGDVRAELLAVEADALHEARIRRALELILEGQITK